MRTKLSNKNSGQDTAAGALRAQSLIRACGSVNNAPSSKKGAPLSECQTMRLPVGEWKGEIDDKDGHSTFELDISDVKFAYDDYWSYSAKFAYTNVSNPTPFISNANYIVTFHPDSGVIYIALDKIGPLYSDRFLTGFTMGLGRLAGDHHLSGHVSMSGPIRTSTHWKGWGMLGTVKLTPTSQQAEQIVAVPADVDQYLDFTLNRFPINAFAGYWYPRIRDQLGEDLDRHLKLANRLFDTEKCPKGCTGASFEIALENYVFVAEHEKEQNAGLQKKISDMYQTVFGASANDEKVKHWKDLAAPVFAQAQAVCESKANQVLYHSETRYVLDSVEPDALINMSRPYTCKYQLRYQEFTEKEVCVRSSYGGCDEYGSVPESNWQSLTRTITVTP